MAIDKVESNSSESPDSYVGQLNTGNKKIFLRKNTVDDPLSWDQIDNNFEILRAKLNEVIEGTTSDWRSGNNFSIPGILKAGEGMTGLSSDNNATHLLEIQSFTQDGVVQGILNINGFLDVDGTLTADKLSIAAPGTIGLIEPDGGTATEIKALTNVSAGSIAWCTDQSCLAVYNGTAWKKLDLGADL